jgi:hypothetical protein
MCAILRNGTRTLKPGTPISASGPNGLVKAIWAGFARSEILSWWKRQGSEEVDVPATEFAERSDVTGKLQWDWVPSDCVVGAVLDHRTTTPLLKILTRASTDAELQKYEHTRMPFLLPRRFAILPAEEPEPDLFF